MAKQFCSDLTNDVLLEKLGGGAVVDKGEKYIKYADGTIVAWGNFSITTVGFGDMSPLKYLNIGLSTNPIDIGVSFSSVSSKMAIAVRDDTNPMVYASISVEGDKITRIWGLCCNSTNRTYIVDYLIIGK